MLWKPSIKHPLKVLMVIGVMSVTAAGCGSTTAADDSADGTTVVHVAGLADVFAEDFQQAVVDPYNEANPDVKIVYKGYPTSAEILSSLRAEKKSPTTNVAILDYSVSKTANAEGLFAKVDPAQIPNLADLEAKAIDPDGFGPNVMNDSLAIVYNTGSGAVAPTSIADLADERYRGKLAIDAPPDVRSLALVGILANGNVNDTAAAFSEFRELGANIDTWKPNPEVNQWVINTEGSAGIGWNARAQLFAKRSDGVLGVVKVPAEGTVVQSNSINLVAGGAVDQQAQEFMNYALSPEAQLAFSNLLAYAPTNTKAVIPADLAAKLVGSSDKTVVLDWRSVATIRDEWTDTWRREVQGG
jgi:putative spermidine/putrescine transport system substrate-binding protein